MALDNLKRKIYPTYENLTVIDIGSEGQGMARHEELVVFINHAVPGDIVDVKVFQKKKNFANANIVKFHEYSKLRAEPACEHFGTCGGCKWQNMNYETQLRYKQKHVIDCLDRIGKLLYPAPLPIIGSKEIYEYRNKLEFGFTDRRWLYDNEKNEEGKFVGNNNAIGFHIPGKFDKIFDVNNCHLQDQLNNDIRNSVKQFSQENNFEYFNLREQTGDLRSLTLRKNLKGQWMVIVMFSKDDKEKRDLLMNFIKIKFPQISSLLYVINTKRNDTLQGLEVKLFSGEPYLIEELENLKFKINPKSFFQTNSKQTLVLYQTTRNFAELNGTELVYDLYTGTGSIALFVSKFAAKIVGIEYVDEAIEDAKQNAALNKITNCTFFAGDMAKVLTKEFVETNGVPDVVISDPPRAGMAEAVINRLLEMLPKKIVYVSCNPATQARDLLLLSAKYQITKVQAVDMFPQTQHIENVVLLLRL